VKMELTDELLSYWERLAEENNNYRLSLHIETLKEIREIKALLKEQTYDRNNTAQGTDNSKH
jgi:hypothetical protein